jgi:Protein of unknown function (DUF1592)/Protein of unknown function (DUF1588)
MSKTRTKHFAKLSLVTLSLLSFQNCSPFSVLEQSDLASNRLSGLGGNAKLNPFQCDGTMGVETTRRLSKPELENTLENLLGAQLFQVVEPALGSLYSDVITKNVADFSNQIDDAQMLGYQTVASRISGALSATPALLSSLGVSCLNGTVTDACKDTAISALGLKAFRRPLTAAESTLFKNQVYALGSTPAESIGWVLYTLVQSPDFLLHIELGAGESDSPIFDLTPYETASRISYMIGDSPPDQMLFDAAAAGRLKTLSEIKPHIDRLFATNKAKEKVHRFFNYWLQPKAINASGFASDFVDGLDVASLSAESLRELDEFIEYVIFTKRGSFKDLILSREAFPRNDEEALVLGAQKVSGAAPSTMNSDRIGLLMRPSVLATDSNETHPIVRGVKFQTRILCNPVSAPVGAILAGDLSFSSDAAKTQYSTRVRTARLTNSTTCMACHSSINPLGFAFENVDNLGRIRSVEKTYASNGTVLGRHPVDTQVELVIGTGAAPTDLSNGVELIENLMAYNRLPACFATQMHRFYRLRERARGDDCVLQEVYSDLMINPNGSILDAFKKQVLNAATFSRRNQ